MQHWKMVQMRKKRWIYVTLCTLAWLVPQAVAAIQIPGFPDMALWFLGTQVLALLTYPAGAVGILPTLIGIVFGIVTPIEALLISGPISLAAGYLQWFAVVPRLFGSDPRHAWPDLSVRTLVTARDWLVLLGLVGGCIVAQVIAFYFL